MDESEMRKTLTELFPLTTPPHGFVSFVSLRLYPQSHYVSNLSETSKN